MTESTEAKNSITFHVTSPEGFEGQITHREDDKETFVREIKKFGKALQDLGFKPQAPKSSGGGFRREAAPKEFVPNRTCPKCDNPLVYFESKGKKHIKCSMGKWNPVTKQKYGCDFVEWASDENEAPPTSQDDDLANF